MTYPRVASARRVGMAHRATVSLLANAVPNATAPLLRPALAQVKRAQELPSVRAHIPVGGRPVWTLLDFPLAEGLDSDELRLVERLLATPIRFRRGDTLFRIGSALDALYAIRFGSCKTGLLGRDCQEQVAGYHMIGDIVGLDGIASNVHECQATALEDMEVYLFKFVQLELFAGMSCRFRHNVHMLLAQELSRAQSRSLLLGTMCVDQRLATFLLDLSQRYSARGFSSRAFLLRMTRDDIGSYLGMTIETVCRVFSRFQSYGVLQVEGRLVKLLDPVALRQIADTQFRDRADRRKDSNTVSRLP